MTARAADVDVAIVGAGVNGAGIARDAALRGLRTVVVDKGDMCSGTSAISSRLIHGGLRYLEYGELGLVFESLRERRTLLRIAPHLVSPLRLTIPLYAGARRGPGIVRLGMWAYDLLSIGKALPRHQMLDREALLAESPALAADGLRGAARYYDAQVTFAERLVLENLLAARAAGARIRTWTEVVGLERRDGEWLLQLRTAGGGADSLTASRVVNAAGPWVDDVLATADGEGPGLIGGTKGSHIVIAGFAGAAFDAAGNAAVGNAGDALYVEARSDGRPFFIIPWNGLLLIGTTDLRYDGSLDSVHASSAEIDYLLAETRHVFPGAALGRESVLYAYAGVRPLPARSKGPESAITRRHILVAGDGERRGLVSVVGGKLTTYRSLAEQVVDQVGRSLIGDGKAFQGGRLPECRTATMPLPGAPDRRAAASALEDVAGLSASGRERLLAIYGGRATQLAARATRTPGTLGDRGRVLRAEVGFAFDEEFAHGLADVVFRRTMLGFDADQGRGFYDEVASLAADARGWDSARRQRELDALTGHADGLRPRA